MLAEQEEALDRLGRRWAGRRQRIDEGRAEIDHLLAGLASRLEAEGRS
jgi:hypothetical protein